MENSGAMSRRTVSVVSTPKQVSKSSNPDTVRAPDVAFVSRERLEEVGPVEGY